MFFLPCPLTDRQTDFVKVLFGRLRFKVNICCCCFQGSVTVLVLLLLLLGICFKLRATHPEPLHSKNKVTVLQLRFCNIEACCFPAARVCTIPREQLLGTKPAAILGHTRSYEHYVQSFFGRLRFRTQLYCLCGYVRCSLQKKYARVASS
jgi:hypothetical protein